MAGLFKYALRNLYIGFKKTLKYFYIPVLIVLIIGCGVGSTYLGLNAKTHEKYDQSQNLTSCYNITEFKVIPDGETGYSISCFHEIRPCAYNPGDLYFNTEKFVNYTCRMVVITSFPDTTLEIISYNSNVLYGIFAIVIAFIGVLLLFTLVPLSVNIWKNNKVIVIGDSDGYTRLNQINEYDSD